MIERLLGRKDLLLDNSLNTIETHLENIHSWTVAQPDVLVARRVKQIPAFRRIQIEEDTRHNNDLLLETSIEEVQTVVDALRERRQIQP